MTEPQRTPIDDAAAFARRIAPGAEIRRYFNTPPSIELPSNPNDVICFHLGGAKRVTRCDGRRQSVHNVPLRGFTVIPRSQSHRWHTEGPVDYAHLILEPGYLADIAKREFGDKAGPDDNAIELRDSVGFKDAFLCAIFTELLALASEENACGRLYNDSLLTCLAIALLRKYSTFSPSQTASIEAPLRGGMAGWRLKRVVDYMDAHLADDPDLEQIAAIAGLSRAQFFRAFRQETGETPARYFNQMRIAKTKSLLTDSARSLDEVAAMVGFGNHNRLRRTFKRFTGVTPATYRQLIR